MIAASPPRYAPKLAQQLALWSTGLSLLTTAIIVVALEIGGSSSSVNQAGQSLADLARQATQRLDEGLAARYHAIRLLSLRHDLLEPPLTGLTLQAALDALQQTDQQLAWIGVTDQNGRVIAATQSLLLAVDMSSRPWWSNALRGKNVGEVSEAHLLESKLPNRDSTPRRFVPISFAYKDRAGRFAGVICAQVSWDWASRVQQSLVAPSHPAGSIEALVVSADNTVLLGPTALLGRSLNLTSLQTALAGKSTYSTEQWPDDQTYLVGVSQTQGAQQVAGLGWKVLLRQNLKEVHQPVRQLQIRAGIVGILVALLCALLGWRRSRRLTEALSRLAQSARQISLRGAAPAENILGSYPEVDQVHTLFAKLIGNLQSKETALRATNAALTLRVEERAQALERTELRLRTITDNLPALIGYVNANLEYEFCNATYEAWLKRPLKDILQHTVVEVMGRSTFQFLEPHLCSALAGKRVTLDYERDLFGEARQFSCTYIPDRSKIGVVEGIYILVIDTTDQKRHRQQLEHSSTHDGLTGLPNRSLLVHYLEQTLALSARKADRCAVLYLNIDGFRSINDVYGHDAGDQMLVLFSQRVRSTMRNADMLSRLGADEFVIVAPDLPNGASGAIHLAQRLLDQFKPPLDINGVLHNVAVSIGIALNDRKDESKEALLHRANQAMYRAKYAGGNALTIDQHATTL